MESRYEIPLHDLPGEPEQCVAYIPYVIEDDGVVPLVETCPVCGRTLTDEELGVITDHLMDEVREANDPWNDPRIP